jgi:hypothetical protein
LVTLVIDETGMTFRATAQGTRVVAMPGQKQIVIAQTIPVDITYW